MPKTPTIEEPQWLGQLLANQPSLAPLATRLLSLGSVYESPAAFFAAVLPAILSAVKGEYSAVVRSSRGEWTVVEETGARRSLPGSLMADVLDEDLPSAADNWVAAPLEPKSGLGELLLIGRANGVHANVEAV